MGLMVGIEDDAYLMLAVRVCSSFICVNPSNPLNLRSFPYTSQNP
jgi:hypothetical protein